MGKTIIGSIIGGILCFGWGSVSWMVLKLHEGSVFEFEDEAAVVEVISKAAPQSGIYFLPKGSGSYVDDIKSGPVIFASVRKEAKPGYAMWRSLMRGALATIVSAIILGIMLHFAAPQLNYIGKVIFVTLGGVFVALAGIYPNNIWWEFSVPFTIIGIVDAVVGWFVAGLGMAALIQGKRV